MKASNPEVSQPNELLVKPLLRVPSIKAGDDLTHTVLQAARDANWSIRDHDILVFAQKIVSKAEGRMLLLDSVTPSQRAIEIAAETEKDPRIVELILSESVEILRKRPGVIVVVHRLGMVLANAGIDQSNIAPGHALLLPVDPDASALRIRSDIRSLTGANVGVLIIDSIGRAWRHGTIGTAIGSSGVGTLLDLRGRPDLYGRRLMSTELGYADELAAAASLVMGQANEGVPVVLVRGAPYAPREGSAAELIRPKNSDLFR